MKNINTLILTASLGLAAAPGAWAVGPADVLYNNLGIEPSDWSSVSEWGPLYASFSSSGLGGTLSGLKLKLTTENESAGTLTVGLYADNSTHPGALVAQLGTFDDTQLTYDYADYTIALTANPALAANARYWIGLFDTGNAAWAFEDADAGTGVAGEFYLDDGDVGGNRGGAFQMKVEVGGGGPSGVPDSGSSALLGLLGLGGLAAWQRRTRQAQ